MTSDWVNYGIVGDVKGVENLAVGPNSRIESTKIDQQSEELQALRRAVEGFEGPAEIRARLLAAHEDVVAELGRADPDKGRVLAKLKEIASVAGSATAIVSAVTALAGALRLIV